jgi:hypothetical protein
MRASAPIRVRLRGFTSWSMSRRARSTAAAVADPSPGTWLRRAGAVTAGAGAAGSAGVPGAAGLAASPFVIVILVPPSGRPAQPRRPNMQRPLPSRQGPFGSRW